MFVLILCLHCKYNTHLDIRTCHIFNCFHHLAHSAARTSGFFIYEFTTTRRSPVTQTKALGLDLWDIFRCCAICLLLLLPFSFQRSTVWTLLKFYLYLICTQFDRLIVLLRRRRCATHSKNMSHFSTNFQ